MSKKRPPRKPAAKVSAEVRRGMLGERAQARLDRRFAEQAAAFRARQAAVTRARR